MREREGKIDEYYISTIMMMEKRKFVGGKMLRKKKWRQILKTK